MRIGGLRSNMENAILDAKITKHQQKITISVIGGHEQIIRGLIKKIHDK